MPGAMVTPTPIPLGPHVYIREGAGRHAGSCMEIIPVRRHVYLTSNIGDATYCTVLSRYFST